MRNLRSNSSPNRWRTESGTTRRSSRSPRDRRRSRIILIRSAGAVLVSPLRRTNRNALRLQQRTGAVLQRKFALTFGPFGPFRAQRFKFFQVVTRPGDGASSRAVARLPPPPDQPRDIRQSPLLTFFRPGAARGDRESSGSVRFSRYLTFDIRQCGLFDREPLAGYSGASRGRKSELGPGPSSTFGTGSASDP